MSNRNVIRLKDSEAGGTLVETVVALAILGLSGVAFLSGLATAHKANFIAGERTTAESLARKEMEYVKSQSYINYADPYHGTYGLITAPGSYTLVADAVPIDPDTGQPLPSGADNGIQKITVMVNHNSKLVFRVEEYKVNR